MKIAYRIVTPVLALGAIAMGLFLKMFFFAIGSPSTQLNQIVQALQMFNVKTEFSFSIYEIFQLLTGSGAAAEGATEEVATNTKELLSALVTVADPILPHVISLLVFFVIALLIFLAIAVVSAATDKRKAVLGLSCSGIGISLICVMIGNFAFEKIVGGEIKLSDVVGLFSENALTQLLTAVISISKAAFSTGIYAIFGMFILIALWTILSNMLIKTPVHVKKKHRRKKPMKNITAMFRK